MTGTSGPRRRVVIVGGGIAGLAAAEALARHHGDRYDITLLESKRQTGGRAGSFTDPDSGETVDYCQHVAMGCCTNLLGLLRRCGLDDSWDRYRELSFLHPDYPPSRFAPGQRLPPPLHLWSAIAALRHLDHRQKGQIRAAMLALMRTPSQAMTAQCAGDWLRQHGQSERTIERFWEVILVSALGERTATVSMAAARQVLIDGFAAARGASDLLVPRRPLSTLFGVRLPDAIRRLGVTIQTAITARRVTWDTPQRFRIETAGGAFWNADHLISAVPWHAVESLLAGGPACLDWPSFARLSASPITGLHLWLDRPITERPHAVLVGTTVQWLFRPSGKSGGRADDRDPNRHGGAPDQRGEPGHGEHYHQVVISAAHSVRQHSKARLIEQVINELRSVFPAAAGARVLRTRVVTDPQAVFSIRPESDAVRPPARTPIAGLHLAGDWIRTGWPATMEGAVISGRMAAASVTESDGLVPPPIDPGLPRGWLARQLIRR